MDEKIKIDSAKLTITQDSVAHSVLKNQIEQTTGKWMPAAGIILGITILLIILFNVRSN